MTENELLLAISNIVQTQIEPLKKEFHDDISNVVQTQIEPLKREINKTNLLIENEVIPRLQEIESCYTSTFRRYSSGVNDIDKLKMDMDIVKNVVSEHSEKLQKIS